MPNPSALPSLPVAVQGVPAPGYSAIDVRRLAGVGVQEGVVAANDFKVTQRAAGAGLAVDVAAGQAMVQGDSVTNQGLYYVGATAALTAATEVTVAIGDANPRLDQIVLEVKDAQHDGSGINQGRVRLIAGAPTAGATLDNRLGAAALPASCLRLADLLMPAAGNQALTANIRDRRPWSRGVNFKVRRTTNAAAGANYSTGGAYAQAIDATNLDRRFELSGVPLEVRLSGLFQCNTAGIHTIGLFVGGGEQGKRDITPPAINAWQMFTSIWEFDAPGAGTSLFTPVWGASAGLIYFGADGVGLRTLSYSVREIVAPSAANQ